jgi:hypothetical protein
MEDFASATYPTTFQMATEKTLGQNYCLAFAEILSHLSPNTVSDELSLRAPVDSAAGAATGTDGGLIFVWFAPECRAIGQPFSTISWYPRRCPQHQRNQPRHPEC